MVGIIQAILCTFILFTLIYLVYMFSKEGFSIKTKTDRRLRKCITHCMKTHPKNYCDAVCLKKYSKS